MRIQHVVAICGLFCLGYLGFVSNGSASAATPLLSVVTANADVSVAVSGEDASPENNEDCKCVCCHGKPSGSKDCHPAQSASCAARTDLKCENKRHDVRNCPD